MDTEVLLPDCEFHKKPFYECIKRIFDLVVSLVAVIVLSPILLEIALAIRLEDRGPILYRAQRVGRGGKPITVYKFRSMRMNADRLEDMLTPGSIILLSAEETESDTLGESEASDAPEFSLCRAVRVQAEMVSTSTSASGSIQRRLPWNRAIWAILRRMVCLPPKAVRMYSPL